MRWKTGDCWSLLYICVVEVVRRYILVKGDRIKNGGGYTRFSRQSSQISMLADIPDHWRGARSIVADLNRQQAARGRCCECGFISFLPKLTTSAQQSSHAVKVVSRPVSKETTQNPYISRRTYSDLCRAFSQVEHSVFPPHHDERRDLCAARGRDVLSWTTPYIYTSG